MARAGSKRVPGKNLRRLAGRPLVQWTLDATRGISSLCDTLVSTDDPLVAEIGRANGALVPWMRPAHLAEDDSSAVDVVLHALDWYETERGRVDGVLLLQPTSPFRSKTSVERGIAAFESHAHRTVLGVSPAESHPMHCLRLENGLLQPFIPSVNWRARTQDLPSAFVLNGAFYLITPDRLRSHRSFFSGELVPLLFDDPAEAVDIDTEADWQLAARLAERSPLLRHDK